MHYFDYQIGPWKAQASIHHVDESKLLATIRISDNEAANGAASLHTIVFERNQALDAREETMQITRDLLGARYQA